jgi:hypothetical protein
MVRRAAVVPYSAVFPMLWVTEDASSVTGRIGQSPGGPTSRPGPRRQTGPPRGGSDAPSRCRSTAGCLRPPSRYRSPMIVTDLPRRALSARRASVMVVQPRRWSDMRATTTTLADRLRGSAGLRERAAPGWAGPVGPVAPGWPAVGAVAPRWAGLSGRSRRGGRGRRTRAWGVRERPACGGRTRRAAGPLPLGPRAPRSAHAHQSQAVDLRVYGVRAVRPAIWCHCRTRDVTCSNVRSIH